MILTEQHILLKSCKEWRNIDSLCFLSKNLYNCALYKIKQHHLSTGKFLRYSDLERQFRDEKSIDYFNLPPATSQQILRLVDRNLKSFFALLRKYKKDKTSLSGVPRFPKYKDKIKGRSVLIIGNQAIRQKENIVIFPRRFNICPVKTKICLGSKICEVRIVPKTSHYVIEIVYEKQEKEKVVSDNILAIDLGVNNLYSCTSNFNKAFIVNGKPLKSINQFYNKQGGEIKSSLEKNHKKKTSKKLQRLTLKRNNKIKDYLHKSSRFIVDYCIKNNVSKVMVGYNKEWKQNVNLGKKNNQSFVQIPFLTGIQQLEYKLKLEGIEIVKNEESYTSKCSALDSEPIGKSEVYLGKRVKRGVFRTSKGILINSDINGSLNIGRKVVGDSYFNNSTNRGFVLNPTKVTLL